MTNNKEYKEAINKYPEDYQEVEIKGMKCMLDMNKFNRLKYMLSLLPQKMTDNAKN